MNVRGLSFRALKAMDCAVAAAAFAAQGGHKPLEQYQNYLREQQEGALQVIVAWCEAEFAGYLVLRRRARYAPFAAAGIPEIGDLNVLIKFRCRGIGAALLQQAEDLARAWRCAEIGLGVGLWKDYGSAQRLYVRLGYRPDGRGLHWRDRQVGYGETVVADDDLVLYLTKPLEPVRPGEPRR